MDQVTSSSELSADEESKLSLGFMLVQDGMAKLANEVKRANKRIKKLEKKSQDAQERATQWENLYKELRKEIEDNKDETSDQGHRAEEDKKPAKRTRGSNQQDAGANKRNCVDESMKDEGEVYLDDISTSQFDCLDDETKEWIATIGLTSAYASRDNGLARITTESYVGPPSFETIFLLVDFLYPVEEGEETYHKRLYAPKPQELIKKTARPGCKVRAALRTIKKKNPANPMVSWHNKGAQWIPPSVEALNGIVKLIVDL